VTRLFWVCAFLALATSAFAEAPPRSTTSGATEHWKSRSVRVTLDPSLASIHAMDAVRLAFGAWLEIDPSLPQVTFVVGEASGGVARDGVSRVLATAHVAPGHERDVAYTVGYADVRSGEIVEADIVFNLAYAFDHMPIAACKKTWDAQAVATHEVGHFFGLDEDLTESSSTMWYSTSPCDDHKRALARADIASIDVLYPIPKEPEGLVAHCSATPLARGSGGVWMIGALFVFCMRRKRRGQ
jgi:hypothetical protein